MKLSLPSFLWIISYVIVIFFILGGFFIAEEIYNKYNKLWIAGGVFCGYVYILFWWRIFLTNQIRKLTETNPKLDDHVNIVVAGRDMCIVGILVAGLIWFFTEGLKEMIDFIK